MESDTTGTEQQPAPVVSEPVVLNGMTLETALEGMADAKARLSRRQAVQSLPIMSEHMQRLATYAVAVEEHLGELEYKQEYHEAHSYVTFKEGGMSPTAAEREARYATAELKAEIKRLTRQVKSAWALIDVIRSRYNHLREESRGQI